MSLHVDRPEPGTPEPIAVIGAGCRLPGVPDVARFWSTVRRCAAVPAMPWRSTARPGAAGRERTSVRIVDDVAAGFDAEFFGVDAVRAHRVHPVQRILLEVVHEAVEDAGIRLDTLAGTRTGTFAAVRAGTARGNGTGDAATAVRGAFDLRGPAETADGDDAGGLHAVHLAARSLRAGECDAAVVAGAALHLPVGATDAPAGVPGRSEGAAVLLLEPLGLARALDHPVHALLLGTASTAVEGTPLPASSAWARARTLVVAHRAGGTAPGDVDYVESSCGPDTPAGERTEMAGLAGVLAADRAVGRPCALGSVSDHVGRVEPLAGIIGLLSTVRALAEEEIPATRRARRPPPAHARSTAVALRPATAPVPWPREPGRRRLAGICGGGAGVPTEVHVVVAEAPLEEPPAPEPETERVLALPLSARSPRALADLAARYGRFLEGRPDAVRLRDIGYSAGVHRTHHEHRAVVLGEDVDELRSGLAALAGGHRAPGVVRGVAPGGPAGPAPRVVAEFVDTAPSPAGPDRAPRTPAYDAELRSCAIVLDRLGGEHPPATRERLRSWAHQVAVAAALVRWGLRCDAIRAEGAGRCAADVVTRTTGRAAAARAVLALGGTEPGAPVAPWPRTLADGRTELTLPLGRREGRTDVHRLAAQAWVAGARVRWDRVLEGGRRVSLPGYPWQHREFGFDPDTAAPTVAGLVATAAAGAVEAAGAAGAAEAGEAAGPPVPGMSGVSGGG